MTHEELLQAILADPVLVQHAIAGEDGDIARAMTRESTATPLTISGLLGALSQESAARLAVNPNVTDLRDKVLSGDIAGVGLWLQLFVSGGIITGDEYNQVAAALAEATPNGVIVDYRDVSAVLKSLRTDGKVGLKNWKGQ